MKPRIVLLSTMLATLALSPQARASTLPRADFGDRPALAAGGGQSLNVAFEAPIDDRLAFGMVAGSRAFVGAAAEAHARYRFMQIGRDPLTLAWLVGAQAAGPAFQNLTEIEPVLGLLVAYPLTPEWTLRASLAAGVLGYELLRPAGIELGYRFLPRMEATVGFNGRGDVAGLRFVL